MLATGVSARWSGMTRRRRHGAGDRAVRGWMCTRPRETIAVGEEPYHVRLRRRLPRPARMSRTLYGITSHGLPDESGGIRDLPHDQNRC